MIFYLYVVSVIALHLVPIGGYELNKMEFGPFRADYLLHSLLFFPWMFLCLSRLGAGVERGLGRGLAWMFVGIFFAIGSEAVQYWIPHRSFNPMDALFNSLGVVAGGVAFVIWRHSRRRSKTPCVIGGENRTRRSLEPQ